MTGSVRKTRVPFWLLGVPVAAWGLHFLSVYAVAAVHCAKTSELAAPTASSLASARWTIAAITLSALAVYGIAAGRGYAGWRGQAKRAGETSPDQERFLGSVVLMLSALSAVATMLIASVSFFFGDCRQ
jgi:hypothetical protein